jgi:hypothetical protein
VPLSTYAFVAFALGIVSSLAETEDRSLSIDNAVMFPPVALPTTVCSPTVSAVVVLSAVA